MPKIRFKHFWKLKKKKKTIKIRTHDLQIQCKPTNPLRYVYTLLVFYFGKEIIDKITLDFIACFDKQYVTFLKCPIPPYTV